MEQVLRVAVGIGNLVVAYYTWHGLVWRGMRIWPPRYQVWGLRVTYVHLTVGALSLLIAYHATPWGATTRAWVPLFGGLE